MVTNCSPQHVQSPDVPQRGDVLVTPEGAFAAVAAERLASTLRDLAASGREVVSMALAGGNTPRAVYSNLAKLPDVPWNRIEIFFGDERAVPADDSNSNYRMARESLLDWVPILPGHVHCMGAGQTDLTEAARQYEALLPEALDLLLLGVGANCHTASLFPGADTLREERRTVLPAISPEPPSGRLTVTPPVLRRARHIVVLASGENKGPAVAQALTGPWNPDACPAQLARGGSWILDPSAASGLPDQTGGV